MPIDIEHYKRLLLDKEQDLTSEIPQLDEEARGSKVAEVEDPIDQVTSDEGKAAAFSLSTKAAETLAEVRAALQRIERGEYGVCIDCGQQIGEKRLDAVPWTAYCLQDQEKHDREDRAEATVFDAAQ